MKDNQKISKKQGLSEEFDAEYDQEQEQQPVDRGTYSKPIITQHMVEAFDHFRMGMDKLASAYTIMESSDPELHRKVSRFGENMVKMIEGFSKLIQQQGGSTENTTKPEALQHYFGKQGMSALGMNENKNSIFEARVDLHLDRIRSIMENSNRNKKH
jgi:hypothetical protein